MYNMPAQTEEPKSLSHRKGTIVDSADGIAAVSCNLLCCVSLRAANFGEMRAKGCTIDFAFGFSFLGQCFENWRCEALI